MKAAVLREVGRLGVEEIDRPTPSFGEVLVRIAAAGMCQTDLSAVHGHLPVPMPLVLGHEGAGVVAEVGPGVTALAPGDHVVLSITAGCGRCVQCQSGSFSLCEVAVPQVLSGTMLDGTTRLTKGNEALHSFFFQGSFAEYAVVPAQCAVRIRPDVPLEIAALLGCGASTGYGAVIRRARVHPGASVAVIGAGGVGLSVVMSARLAGAHSVIVADRSADALKLALDLGATDAVQVGDDNHSLAQAVAELAPGGVDFAFDAVGVGDTLAQAFEAIRPGGLAVAIGMADVSATVTLPVMSLIFEKRLTGTYNGSIRPHIDIPAAIDAYLDGRLPLDRLVGKRVELQAIGSAIADFGQTPGRSVIVF